MELIMLFVALFVFCFGSILVTQLFEFGIRVGDKALQSSGFLIKLPFIVAFKLVCFVGKKLLNKLKSEQPEVQLRTIYVTPVELQHMRNNQLFQSKRRSPVLIEHPPLND